MNRSPFDRKISPAKPERQQTTPAKQADVEFKSILGDGAVSELVGLYRQVALLLAPIPHMVVQFMGIEGDEGVSTITREFSHITATELRKSVLLVEVGRGQGEQQEFFSIIPRAGGADADVLNRQVKKAISCAKQSGSLVVSLEKELTSDAIIVQSNEFLNVVRPYFDIVVVDSGAAMSCSESLMICPKVDGVILVVEAEKTSAATTALVKEKIAELGGNLLGAVLNRHHNYIPKFVTKFLKPRRSTLVAQRMQ
jgi:protein-tyrosine kinase